MKVVGLTSQNVLPKECIFIVYYDMYIYIYIQSYIYILSICFYIYSCAYVQYNTWEFCIELDILTVYIYICIGIPYTCKRNTGYMMCLNGFLIKRQWTCAEWPKWRETLGGTVMTLSCIIMYYPYSLGPPGNTKM